MRFTQRHIDIVHTILKHYNYLSRRMVDDTLFDEKVMESLFDIVLFNAFFAPENPLPLYYVKERIQSWKEGTGNFGEHTSKTALTWPREGTLIWNMLVKQDVYHV